MKKIDKKAHWEHIYQTRELQNVSWYQQTPTTSLDFLNQFNVSKTAKIIDIGGGDSFLVDNLLDLGYQDITVLDISLAALDKAKLRLGNNASKIKCITVDHITPFVTVQNFVFCSLKKS